MLDAMTREHEVAVAGDWHSDRTWLMNVFSRIRTGAPGVKTILQLGDVEIGVGPFAKAILNFIDERCQGAGIDRVLVTPGNHDNWDRLESRTEWQLGLPVPLSRSVWALPPGFRFQIGGKSFLSFGGAASIQDGLIRGKNWWPQEVPAESAFQRAQSGGSTDVLLTHEAINGGPATVRSIIESKASTRWPADRRAASARSRDLITSLYETVAPQVAFHGHMHIYGEPDTPSARRIYALADNRTPGNAGILTLPSLSFRRV